MPQTVFVEVFHLLSPDYFVVPYRKIHWSIHPKAAEYRRYQSLDSIFNEFATNLATVVQVRQSAGQTLGLAEYTHLLDCARSIGDALMADYIWHNMEEGEVVPDVTCYNHYMEAKVWDKAYTGTERYNLRMTPFAYRHRRFEHPNPGWRGFGTAGRSVRKEVLEIFNEMTEQGNVGDETSFINVMLASSRVGHMDGVKGVLKTVWNVDVDALAATSDPSGLPEATEYDRSSPLYPSSRLLSAIAHVFGTNNNISAALSAIEFISNSYDIPVPEAVWLELFERSFVLSRPKFSPDAERNSKGKVSYNFLKGLYDMMTSAPFNTRPTIQIRRMLAKTAYDEQKLSDFQYHMQAAYEILRETRRKRRTARAAIESYLRNVTPTNTSLLLSRAFAEAVHTYDVLRLSTAQQTSTIENLAKLFLIHNRWTGRDNTDWKRRILPQALEEWRDFLPESLAYTTNAGLLEFHGKTKWRQVRPVAHTRVQVRRPTADNNVHLDEEAMQVDDDFYLANYLRRHQYLDLEYAPLKRLFAGVTERGTLNFLNEQPPDPSVNLAYDDEYIVHAEEGEQVIAELSTEKGKQQRATPDDYDISLEPSFTR
ncbi:mitochondrial ATPase expression-domain-containing protein [Aspergillus avenaceus]|uniref:Mitochondrial ATPase expression-domain-containing protein n=1 Tax=Aspergillus avenaceus TaxID=36643 RepID=A0A5N6TP48_ASPAV|nr:mitochondrial ATPase expression-domain-containing protein [Aspergillus avenaceus]